MSIIFACYITVPKILDRRGFGLCTHTFNRYIQERERGRRRRKEERQERRERGTKINVSEETKRRKRRLTTSKNIFYQQVIRRVSGSLPLRARYTLRKDCH